MTAVNAADKDPLFIRWRQRSLRCAVGPYDVANATVIDAEALIDGGKPYEQCEVVYCTSATMCAVALAIDSPTSGAMSAQEYAKMAMQVLFVHGGGEGAYAQDSKLVASLDEKLGPNYTMHYPMMPREADPDYRAWKQRISEELALMGDGAILVGHSIGASVVIKLLADQDIKRSVAGVFLIAAPFWHDHEVWRWEEVELPSEAFTVLPSGMPVFLYHGRADEVVPFTHVEMYGKALPQAIVRRLDGRNHQLNDDLTEVANDISQLR